MIWTLNGMQRSTSLGHQRILQAHRKTYEVSQFATYMKNALCSAADGTPALIKNAATYNIIDPDSSWPAWEVNITCIDWKNRCTGKVMAYTTNPQSRRGQAGIFMDTITFCQNGPFLEESGVIESCPVLLHRYEKLPFTYSGNLVNYQCWGKCLDSLCNKAMLSI